MILLPYAIDFALICFGAAILMNLWLIGRGPGVLDRVLALDTMTVNVIALITLEEGPRMMSNVIGCDVTSVTCGLAVEVVFEPWSADITMPKFRPIAGTPG